MAQLTHDQYEILERAVVKGLRVAIQRRGRREHIVIPISLRLRDGREVIEARNPTTGHDLTFFVDEIATLEAMP